MIDFCGNTPLSGWFRDDRGYSSSRRDINEQRPIQGSVWKWFVVCTSLSTALSLGIFAIFLLLLTLGSCMLKIWTFEFVLFWKVLRRYIPNHSKMASDCLIHTCITNKLIRLLFYPCSWKCSHADTTNLTDAYGLNQLYVSVFHLDKIGFQHCQNTHRWVVLAPLSTCLLRDWSLGSQVKVPHLDQWPNIAEKKWF